MGMRINSEGIAGLGDHLGLVADQLQDSAADTRGSSGDSYGFVDGTTVGALDTVKGDFELLRIAMSEELRRLRDLAQYAGGCYLTAEEINTRRGGMF